MRKLTGKAKEAFLAYCKKNEMFMSLYDDVFLNAFIIEWLDSVGIYIEINVMHYGKDLEFSYNIQEQNTLNGRNGLIHESRTDTANAAITKAIEIFNNRK